MALPDIQDQVDGRGIDLDRVGIAGVQYPLRFNDGTTIHAGIATFDVAVTLPADRRGTHMSRMVEIIHYELQDLEPERLPQALKVAADRLDVDSVQVSVALPMAFLVQAPASGKEAWQVCDVRLDARHIADRSELAITVGTDVTSLCPCSKAISDYGAHNQRSRVQLTTVGRDEDVYPLDVANRLRDDSVDWVQPRVPADQASRRTRRNDAGPQRPGVCGRHGTRSLQGVPGTWPLAPCERAQLREHPQPRRGGVGRVVAARSPRGCARVGVKRSSSARPGDPMMTTLDYRR